MQDNEVFYRNVDLGDMEEIAVKASHGYGDVIEIIVDGNITETIIRITSPVGAIALGKAIAEAGEALLRR